MYVIIDVFATEQFSMAAISFVIACKELKIVQINQLLHLLNLFWTYGEALYALNRMLMRKNLNNEVSKAKPMQLSELFFAS